MTAPARSTASDDKTWADYELDAAEWIAEHGADALVKELRQAVADRRRIRLGTTNALILLAYIDKLEGSP